MIFQAPILALLLVSALAALVALWAGWFGIGVLRHWDLASGTRAQLRMERGTELVSTLFGAVMLAETAALLLFVYNADRMATLFVGAMCAIGTLQVNAYGFPTLWLKIAVFFAAAIWLILDRVDRMGRDFPLTRVKYALIVVMAPLILAAGAVELTYFLGLKTDVITSCCSRLFTPVNEGISGDLSAVTPGRAFAMLAISGATVALSGSTALWRGKGFGLHALTSAAFFLVALIAIVAVISPYIYQTPSHHCPFCILQPEYSYIGYALYVPLFGATALALGAGLAGQFTGTASLADRLPKTLKTLTVMSLAGQVLFGLVTLAIVVTSPLILFY